MGSSGELSKELSDEGKEKGVDAEPDEIQISKNLLQSIHEWGRQLSYASSKCVSIESLFGSEFLSRRGKMREMCEKLLFTNPEKYGLVARDKLWRTVYYEVVCVSKKLKKSGVMMREVERNYLQSHILNGVGHLSGLLLKLSSLKQMESKIFNTTPDGIENILPPSLTSKLIQNSNSDALFDEDESWLVNLLYTILLNIGDLCRYMADLYSQNDDEMYSTYFNRAQDYYSQAFNLSPQFGMAHNQLGNLKIKSNGGIDSTYYFLYSLCSGSPYEGAFMNLRQLLDSELVRYARMSAATEINLTEIFAHSFISMIYHFICEPSHLKNFQHSCQDTLVNFYKLLTEENESFDDGLLFKISTITIMTVWRLQNDGSPNVSASVAFAIGIFLQLIQQLLCILESNSSLTSILSLNIQNHPTPPPSSQGSSSPIQEIQTSIKVSQNEKNDNITSIQNSENDEKSDKNENRVELVLKNGGLNSRRRARVTKANDAFFGYLNSDSEEESNENDSCTQSSTPDDYSSEEDLDESDLSDISESENEEISSASSDEIDNFSQNDEELERRAAELKLSQETNSNVENIEKISNSEKMCENEEETSVKCIDFNNLVRFWSDVEGLIVGIYPFFKWLQTSPQIQTAFASNCEKMMLEKFSGIFNLIQTINWNYEQIGLKYGEEWKKLVNGDLKQDFFKLKLPEDFSLSGLTPFNENKMQQHGTEISPHLMMMCRVGRILEFGHWLVSTEDFAIIRSENSFLVPSIQEFKKHMRKLQMEKFEQRMSNSNEAKLLGGLYQASVDENSKNRRRNGARNEYENDFSYPEDEKIFVFVDLAAVLKDFKTIQKLSTHSKFTIIFPFSVYQKLDDMKDSEGSNGKTARCASRWLEREGHKGAKNTIRILGEHEKLELNLQYPSHQTDEIKNFYDVLESCNYFQLHNLKNMRSGGHPKRFFRDNRDKFRMFFLTGNKTLMSSSTKNLEPDFRPISASHSTNVYLDFVTRYHSKNRLTRRRRGKNMKKSG